MLPILYKLAGYLAKRDIRKVISQMGEEASRVRDLRKEELIRLHHGLGRYLRNSFRQRRYGALFLTSSWHVQKSGQPMSFDAISSAAIEKIWQVLQMER